MEDKIADEGNTLEAVEVIPDTPGETVDDSVPEVGDTRLLCAVDDQVFAGQRLPGIVCGVESELEMNEPPPRLVE